MKSGIPSAIAIHALLCLSSPAAEEEEKADALPEIVVEAGRGSVIPAHMPGNAVVIGEKQITESGARSVADLLTARGGLRLSSTSGNASGGAVQMRGFGENSSSRVLMLVDGRPVNRADMGAISLLEVPVSRIEKVEILRGSQTARFGDNAVAGVINLVTRRTRDGGEGYLESAGGSDGYSLFRAGYGARSGGQGVRVDLERNFSDGWRENAASEAESAAIRYDLQFGRTGLLDAGFSWMDEYTGFPGPLPQSRYEEDPRQSVYHASGQGDQYFSGQQVWRTDATISYGKEAGFSFEMPVMWTRRDQEWNMGPGFHTDNMGDTATLSPTLSRKGERWRAEAGAAAKYDRLDLTQFAEISRRNRTGTAELSRWVLGFFASGGWEPLEGWHLESAARVEHAAVDAEAANFMFPTDPELNFSRGNREWNWAFQLGLRWEGPAGPAAWLRYDRLYRLPSTDEIASYQGYPLRVPFNDRLGAETGHQIELGTGYERDGWHLRANGFIQWLEGEIAYDYLRNLNLNFADTRRVGIELEAGYRGERWETMLRYTWLDAEFQDGRYDGRKVYLVPDQEFSALLGWRPLPQLLLQAEYQFAGNAFEGNDLENTQPVLPEYGVANLLVRWEPAPGFSIHARVNNVSDERYATVKYNGVWYPAAGRQMLVGMRKEF